MQWFNGLALTKDPDAVLDYNWSFADWLAVGDDIASHSVIAESGITVDSSSNDSNSVTVWLSGGTVGAVYKVTVRITTSQARTTDRSVYFSIVEQ